LNRTGLGPQLARNACQRVPRRLLVIGTKVARSLQRILLQILQRHPVLVAYIVFELISFQRFRRRIARLQISRCCDRRGTLDDLKWWQSAVNHPSCPLSISKHSLQRFLDDQEDAAEQVTWEHYYAIVSECFCIATPSPSEHQLILKITASMAAKQGLAQPPAGAKPPNCQAPLAFGRSPVQVFHKPLIFEACMYGFRCAVDVVLLACGFRPRWIPTPEGWMRYWVALPVKPDSGLMPAVFVHGVGMGAAPYVLFLERIRRSWGAKLIVIELPNVSRSHFQDIMPNPSSFRGAVRTILKNELDISAPGQYILLGHSLGTDFCTSIMNDPFLDHGGDSLLRPCRLVLMDPVCFAIEAATSHRLAFWTWREAVHDRPRIMWPFMLAMWFLIIRDEAHQEAMKRALSSGTDFVFRCSRELLQRCPVLVCLSGNDEFLPAWKIHDYIRAQFPDIRVRMDPALTHGAVMAPAVPGWLAWHHASAIIQFLKPDIIDVPRTASQPTVHQWDDSRPLRKKSRSDLALGAAGQKSFT